MASTPVAGIALVVVGLWVGTVSGMVGIGGGVLVTPVLMVGFGLSQSKANGTSLAMMLPPIGVFAVLTYSKAGNVDWRAAGLLACGFAACAYFGAKLVNSGRVNPTALRFCFATLLMYSAGRILFRPGGRAQSALEAAVLAVAFGLTYLAFRLLGRRWAGPTFRVGDAYRERQREMIEHDYEI